MQPVTFILVLVMALLGSVAGCCSTNVTVVRTFTKIVTDTAVFNHVNSTIISTSYTRSGVPKSGKSLTSSTTGLTSTQTTTDFVTITWVPKITCTVGHECPNTSVAAVVAPTSPNVSDTAADTSFVSSTTTLKDTTFISTRTSTITYTLEKMTSAAPAPIVSTSIWNGTAEFTVTFPSHTTQMSATSTAVRGPPFPKLNASVSATANFTYLAAAKQAVNSSSSMSLINGSGIISVYSPPPRPEIPLTDSSTTTVTVTPPLVISDSSTTESTSTVVITPTVTQTTINTSTGTSTITQLVVATASSGVQGRLTPARHFIFLAALAKMISKAAAEIIDTAARNHHDACPCTTFSADPCAGCSSFYYNPTSSGDRMGSRPTKALFAMANKYVKARAVADEVTQTTVTVTRYLLRANSTSTSTVYNATTTVYCSTCAEVNSTTSTSLNTTGSVLTALPYPYGIVAPSLNSTRITRTHPPATEPTAKVASRAALVSVGCLMILAMAVTAI